MLGVMQSNKLNYPDEQLKASLELFFGRNLTDRELQERSQMKTTTVSLPTRTSTLIIVDHDDNMTGWWKFMATGNERDQQWSKTIIRFELRPLSAKAISEWI